MLRCANCREGDRAKVVQNLNGLHCARCGWLTTNEELAAEDQRREREAKQRGQAWKADVLANIAPFERRWRVTGGDESLARWLQRRSVSVMPGGVSFTPGELVEALERCG